MQITVIMNILTAAITNVNDWDGLEKLKQDILESALMPSIEATYRSGSLLEMSKELECVFSYLDFTDALIDCPALFELLLEIDPKFKPSQRDPVYKLIKHLTGLSETLLKCLPDLDSKELTEEQKEQNKKPK